MPPIKKAKNSPRFALTKISNNTWLWLILILGILLRFYNNTAVALWHDEAFSALYLRYPFSEMMRRIGLDVHPPLYYWLLKLWTLVLGQGLLSLRGFSILFGALTIWAGFLFVRKAFGNEKLAIVAAFFLAINPFQIQYSLEARMYTLGTFLVMISSYLLVRALESNKTRDWFWYGLATAGGLYTHYYMFFAIAAQGLYVLYYLYQKQKFRDSLFLKSMGSYVFALLLFVPWLPTFLTQLGRVEKAYWIPAPDRWSVPSTIWKMSFGGQGMDHWTLAISAIVALVIVYYFYRETKPPIRWMVILGLTVPFVGALLVSFKQAIYQDRYFVFTSLYMTILIACALFLLPKYTTRRNLTILFAAFSLFIFFKNWHDLGVKNLFFNRDINYRPGMAAASSFVNDSARPNDKIYVGSSFIYFTFKYYNHTTQAPRLISSIPLDQIPHFSGTALLKPDDLVLTDTIFNHPEVKANDIVWLLWTTGFGGSKPNVPGTWSIVTQKQWADTPGFKGDIYVTEYHVN
jgi:mannosyltransferase